jgi:hypothetical protein
MMRNLINFIVVVSLVSLTGCIPGLFGGGTYGQASLQYSNPSGDTTGFLLTDLSNSNVLVSRFSKTSLLISIQPSGTGDIYRVLSLTLAGQLAPGFSCPLTQGNPSSPSTTACTLSYGQVQGTNSVQGNVTSGTATVTAYDGPSLGFTFEATIQTPAGGSFTVRGAGTGTVQN